MKSFRLRSVLALLGLTVAASVQGGCGGSEPEAVKSPTPRPSPTLRVAAASDLRTALPSIIERFKTRTGIDVIPSFDSSGHISEQIKAGAPFDVFLAANQSFVKKLADEKLVLLDSVRPYARGALVLAVHKESGSAIQSLADLAKPEIKKIALANPAFAPYGAAGKQALERDKLWSAVEPKIVQAESIMQALQFVQSGNAEAGLVGKAIADVPEVRTLEIDPKLYDPIIQGLGIVAQSSNQDAARSFAQFVLGPEGQEVLGKYGFAKPELENSPQSHRDTEKREKNKGSREEGAKVVGGWFDHS